VESSGSDTYTLKRILALLAEQRTLTTNRIARFRERKIPVIGFVNICARQVPSRVSRCDTE
jgi:hypothetical protein